MASAAGTKLGPYETLRGLGAGGTGEVYRARLATVVLRIAERTRDADCKSLATPQAKRRALRVMLGLKKHTTARGMSDLGVLVWIRSFGEGLTNCCARR